MKKKRLTVLQYLKRKGLTGQKVPTDDLEQKWQEIIGTSVQIKNGGY